jgi:hypothetical protein
LILKLLALRHGGVGVREIVGGSRLKAMTSIRHEAVFLIWTHTGRSFADIGSRIFGKRDHTTCINSVKKHLASRPDRQWLHDVRRSEEGAEVLAINKATFDLFDLGWSRPEIASYTGLAPWRVEQAANRHYWHVRGQTQDA